MDARDGNAELEPTAGSRTHATNAASLSTRRGTAAASSRGTTRAVVVSLALHGAIAIALLGTAWGVSGALREEPPPIVLTADFFQPAPTRPTPRASTSNAPSAAQTDARANTNAMRSADELDARLRALEAGGPRNAALDGLARRFGAETSINESPATRAGASFAGLVSGNATKVA